MAGKAFDIGKLRFWPHGVFLILLLGVITLSVMACIQPILAEPQEMQTPVLTETPSQGQSIETDSDIAAQTQQALPPPTPDEIGSTTGIIIWAMILVLILLIGTLRETLHRKGQ